MRDRYGRTTYGQGCLLARRLVEAGVKFVNVYFASHRRHSTRAAGTRTASTTSRCIPILEKYLLPMTDQTLPTLLEDLEERGLLDDDAGGLGGRVRPHRRRSTTSPAATTGRSATRRCWRAAASSAASSIGASDSTGAFPASDPVRPGGSVGDDVPPAGHRPGHRSPRRAEPAAADQPGQGDRWRIGVTAGPLVLSGKDGFRGESVRAGTAGAATEKLLNIPGTRRYAPARS